MEELKTLSRLVTYSYNLSAVLPIENNTDTKEGKFIFNIKSGKYNSDTEAAYDLYRSSPNDVRYKMLKHRIKKKFFNNLYFIDYSKLKIKIYFQKEQECLGLLHQAHVLLRQREIDIAVSIARKILVIAAEFDFLNLTIAAYEFLLICFSEQGALKKFVAIKSELEIALTKKRYEAEAVITFQQIRIHFKKSIRVRKETLPSLPNEISRLKKLWELAGTFDAFNAYYKTSLSYYELIGDFSKIVDLTIISEKWVEENKVNPQRFDSSFNKFILVYAHLRAKEFKSGLIYADRYLESFRSSSWNWFAYMENYFLLAVHSKNYELASTLIHQVFNNNAFTKLLKASKERWVLYQAYLNIALNKNFSTEVKENNPFLLSLPEYSKDKQGFNVAILVLQFIYFLKKADSEALLYRIESLKKYIYTHLSDTFSLRSKLFFKLLMLTVTENLDETSCIAKGEKNFSKLKDTPTPGDAYAEIEIIPYEHLWELIIDILKSKSS